MKYFATMLVALSVLTGAGVAAQAAPYGAQTAEQQQPSPN